MADAGSGALNLPSKKTNQGCHGMAVRGPDLYPTPSVLTEALLSSGEELPKHIWEPCAGMGHMASVLSRAGHTVVTSDAMDYGWQGLLLKRDFFEFTSPPTFALGDIDCIVTNPPYGNDFPAKMIRHGLRLCSKVVILNRLTFLEGSRRKDIIDRNLTRVYPFMERPPMMHRWSPDDNGVYREWSGRKTESAMPVAWFVFERTRTAPVELRRISWRHQS